MRLLLTRLLSPLFCLAALAPAASAAAPLGEPRSWAVFYGAQAEAAALAAPDLLVLEPDHPWDVRALRRPGQRVLAYLSLGEVHASRPYFARVKAAKGALVGQNPDWPDAHRVDPRSAAWRKLVVEAVAPAILARGYDGFFLDTLDVAEHLEGQGRRGAVAAMGRLLGELHARHPEALLVANGGRALLPAAAGALSALATESVFTDYRFKPAAYRPREAMEAAARAQAWQALGERHGLPVLVIEYVDPEDAPGRREAADRARAAGFVPFVSDIGLTTLRPTPEARP